MIFTKNGGYYNASDFYVEEGYINLIFADDLDENGNLINEAFHITAIDDKSKTVDIYIRNKSEGRGGDMPHWTTIKAQAINQEGKRIGEQIPYTVPQDKYEKCELDIDTKSAQNFDRKYGDKVRAFVDHSYELINEYWNADTNELDEIERKIYNKYKRYKKLKSKGKIHH